MLCLSVTKWTLDASDLKYDKKKKASLTLPIGNQSAKYHLQKIQTKKCLNLPGIEPGISGSVDRRLIHWAIGPYERIMIAVVFSTELMWFWFLMLAWMRNINTRFFGSMFGRNVRGNEDLLDLKRRARPTCHNHARTAGASTRDDDDDEDRDCCCFKHAVD